MRSFWRACAVWGAALASSAVAQDLGPTVNFKPGLEVLIPVTIADGGVKLGPPRRSNPGRATPKDGEIAVSVVKKGLSPYAELTATEKTTAPVDFVATGLIGDIKIDEIKVCGRLDQPVVGRIASGSWRISLNRLTARAGDATCQP